jgi:molybdenum cofactor guanylyltransferase
MNPGATPVAAILAGGASRRMGFDKASICTPNGTLLEHSASCAAACGLQVIVVGRPAPPGWKGPRATFVADATPGLGPLGGLITALSVSGASVLALACDMPLLSPECVSWLLRAHADPAAPLDGVATLNGSRIEPLFSVYEQSVTSLATDQVARGDHSLRGLVAAGSFRYAQVPPALQPALRNINTLQDLESLGSAVISPR